MALQIEPDVRDEIKVLNGLIETCKDGEKGFSEASEKAKDTSLKALFTKYAVQRRHFAQELQSAVLQLGGDPADSGHVAASLHRGWISVKEALSSDGDTALINECESGEDAAMKNYQEALQQTLSPPIRSLIEHQFAGIQMAHSVVRDLKHSHQ
ncbi:MAG TPA: PA2169 family four-helix-bundle protein [Bryobacteraceae bacterium]|nr:PA2169 family four-helix-bundle protein [Bryobacteraceae bacterium]